MANWFASAERAALLRDKVQMHFDLASEHYGANAPWVTMLYGSQNYHLDTEESDVDTKTMLFPTLKDVVLNRKMVSTDLQAPDLSLNNVKDYRAMFQNYLKGNVNFLETLFTDHYVVTDRHRWAERVFLELRTQREMVAGYQPVRLMQMAAGMADQKYHAMEHKYESKAEVLAKYGYDPKQLHHLCRLPVFMRDFMNTGKFGTALFPEERARQYLLSLKTNPLPLKEARELKEEANEAVGRLLAQAKLELPEYNHKEETLEFLEHMAVEVFFELQREQFVCTAY